MPQYATAYNPKTGQRKRVVAGDPNAFAGGFQLDTRPATPATFDPMAETVRRSLALEGSLVPETEFGIPDLEKKAAEARKSFRARYLAGFELPDLVRQEAEGRQPTLKATRAEVEAKYADPKYADPNSESFIPPEQRQAIINQELNGGREYLSRVTDKVGRLYDKNLEGEKGSLDDLLGELDSARARYTDKTSRARALLGEETARKFDSRFDDLTRREKEASIAAANRSNRGGGSTGLSPIDIIGLQKSNPLGLAQLKGYTRELAPDGGKGFWFYKDGKPVTVDEVANAVGTSKAALLAGSDNPDDQNAIKEASGKATLSPATQKDINSISDALNVLRQIESTSQKINTKTGLSARAAGPLKWAQGAIGQNADVTRFQSNIGYLSRIVRAMGEVGALNEGDIDRARTLIPKLGDSQQEAANKINDLREILNRNMDQRKNTRIPSITLDDIIDTGV